MPINIYNEDTTDRIAWLCDEVWDLPNQISELEKWIEDNAKSLPKAHYVVDVGFDIRPDANGGGAVIDSKLMRLMSKTGFDLYLSEYPNQINDQK